MVTILDQSGDTTRRDIFRFSKLYDFPGYVKQAAPSKVIDPDPTLAATAFADVRTRQFNCSSKAATWLSHLFFLEKGHELSEKIAGFVEERLTAFANQWGIAPDIQVLREKHAALHQDAMPDSAYMLVWASDNGRKDREYPLRNALEVKAAADWFMRHRDHFEYADRKTMATKLLEKASEFGAAIDEDVDEALEKQAGRGTYNPKTAAEHIRNRVRATSAPEEISDKLLKFAEAVETNPGLSQDPTTIAGLCSTVDTFDRLTKLSGHYTSNIPRPEEIFCTATYKTAKAAVDDCCTLLTGTVYNQEDFSKLALSDLRDAFGNDLANTVSDGLNVHPEKLAEVVATFPRSDAQLFDTVLADAGIAPMMKQAVAVHGPSFEELQNLASIRTFIGDLTEREAVRL